MKVLLKMSVKDNIIPHIRECKSTKNINCLLFLKSKILSIIMGENESIIAYISRITELRDKLGDIREKVLNTDLVTITLNGMTDDYQMLMTRLIAREKAPTFEEMIGILMQEEER